MLQDLRFGLKLLWKDKAFTATALVTLALCIGANTAIFSVLEAVVLAPLPFPEPDRLVTLYNIYPGVGVTDVGQNSVPDYLDRKQMTGVFDSVTLHNSGGFDAGAEGSPRRIDGQYCTPSYFRVLRVAPALGRAFSEQEATPGNDKFAVLSYGLWKEMYALDRGVLGKDIRLSGVPYRILGVMPEGFGGVGRDVKLWVPLAFTPQQASDDARHNNNWNMTARLAPGVTAAGARERVAALNRTNLERFPQYRKLLEDARFQTVVAGLKDDMVREIRPTLYLLEAAVALVLLIGCVNVASLMLVRSNIRMKEMAVRFSLGASRWRLGRQLLTEGVTLAVLGGGLGIMLGSAGMGLLARLGAGQLPRGADLRMDGPVLAFSAAIAVLTGLVFGSVPVAHLFRRDLNAVFRQTERTGTVERHAIWTRSALVVAQVALAFVLLIGSGLLTISFARLLAVNPGFRPDKVVTAKFSLPRTRYAGDGEARRFIQGLLENVRSIPGVRGSGATTYLPFSSGMNASVITLEGHSMAPGELPPVPAWNTVDSGYFQAMGIPLLAGRGFVESDTAESRPVVVIDQFLARKYWPNGNPIGAGLRRGMSGPGDTPRPLCTVIGVIGTVKARTLAEQNPVGQIYFYYKQFPPRSMHLVVRTDRDDAQFAGALRARIARADPELPLYDVKTMPQRVSASVLDRRAAAVLCLAFAGLALLLAAIGLYGVLAYTVTQRTREFGIRVALGAGRADVLRMVVGQGLKLAALGLAIGGAAAFATARLMSAMLYGVRAGDPGVFLAVAGSLMMVALVAALIPSLRAVRIHPAGALRYE